VGECLPPRHAAEAGGGCIDGSLVPQARAAASNLLLGACTTGGGHTAVLLHRRAQGPRTMQEPRRGVGEEEPPLET
jgi:hypothetical protein